MQIMGQEAAGGLFLLAEAMAAEGCTEKRH
jgi:hypothetical protein